MTREQRHGEHWWEMLPAIPREKDSHEYRRLQRVWFDHTWDNHPFLPPQHENHLTATLFENFTALGSLPWPAALLCAAGFDCQDNFTTWSWGYEVLAQPRGKLADVAIHAKSVDGDYVIVIEAKAKGGTLKKTDGDPASYLDLDEFSWAPKRSLIYLVDKSDAHQARNQIKDSLERSGLLTWQALGGLQIELALSLDCAPSIRDFVAGAIQYQFLNHGLTPDKLVANYLAAEPSRANINPANPEKMRLWTTQWRLKT
jgi:hypothetical protein